MGQGCVEPRRAAWQARPESVLRSPWLVMLGSPSRQCTRRVVCVRRGTGAGAGGGTEEGHFEHDVSPQATHCRLPESSMSGAESVLPWRLILRLAPPSPSGPLSSSSLESVSFAAAVSACQGRGQGSCGQGQARARVKRQGQVSSRDQDLVHALGPGPSASVRTAHTACTCRSTQRTSRPQE